MSYILDSLKKSEQQRRQGELPNLQSEHPGSAPPPRRKRPVWPWLVVLALLINAGLLAWWILRDTPADTPQAAMQPPPLAQPAPSVERLPAETTTQPPQQQELLSPPIPIPAPEPATVPATAKEEPVVAVPDATETSISEAPKPEVVVPAAPLAVAKPQAAAAPAPPVPAPPVETGVTPLDELPGGIRSTLPKLSLSLHYYTASPDRRLVRLNGRNLREGADVEGGVVLEEIRPDGAVVSYRGQMILLPRP